MVTLPRRLTPRLLAFCQGISTEQPVFIRSKPSGDARLGYCFDNVTRKIDRAGGTIAYGWAVWHFEGAYFEAEHHGVWRKRSGELVDVSPQYDNYPKILFLSDLSAVYDPAVFRSNQVATDGDDPRSTEVVALMRKRYALLDACRARDAIGPDLQTQIQVDAIVHRIGAILTELT